MEKEELKNIEELIHLMLEDLFDRYELLEKENTELKHALEINKRLYESKCNEVVK